MVNKTKSGIFTTILFHVASHRLGHDLRFDFFFDRRFEMFISLFVLKIEIDITASNMQRNLFITPHCLSPSKIVCSDPTKFNQDLSRSFTLANQIYL
jgi:hypothetical protein